MKNGSKNKSVAFIFLLSVLLLGVQACSAGTLFCFSTYSAITLLFFLSLLYSYPVFGAPTAPRAFELLAHFNQSQFGTDLRQCSCFSDSVSIFLSFFITLFIIFYFPIDLNGEMLIGENSSHDYSATVHAEIHTSSCLSVNISHTTLTYRHVNKTYLAL